MFPGRRPVAAFVARNCPMRRNRIVTDLVEAGLEVHALGKCTPRGAVRRPVAAPFSKIEALKDYAVYLAFENSDSEDYVSEKVHFPPALATGNRLDGRKLRPALTATAVHTTSVADTPTTPANVICGPQRRLPPLYCPVKVQ